MFTFRQVSGYNHGTFKDVTEKQIENISNHSNTNEVGRRIIIGRIEQDAFATTPAELSFMDDNCAKWGFAEANTGRNPKSGNEIAMDTSALKLLGVEPKIGTKIDITYTVGSSMEYAYEKTDTFTLVGWWEYDDVCPIHCINISEEYVDKLESEAIRNGIELFQTDLNVMLHSIVNIRKQMEQIEQDLGYTWDENAEGEYVRFGVNWGYTSSQVGEKTDITTIVAVVVLLALIIFTGYLIIYNIFQISVTGDIRFYGLLKTIGVTPRQLGRIIRQQALFLCIVGIPIGLLLGYGIGVALTPLVLSETMGKGAVVNSTSPLIFLISALFAVITVLLSCARPGMMAAKVSPVEATKYTEINTSKAKRRATRGAKVHQMAFANLGRNKIKTILVVISLAFSMVLLDVLVCFTGGFDMDKYLEKLSCSDFIVSTTDYFRGNEVDQYITLEQIDQIEATTSQSLSGCSYKLNGYMPMITDKDMGAQVEGLDDTLFKKLTVIDGDLTPMFQEDTNAIAIVVQADDYGNVSNIDSYPSLDSNLTIEYVDEVEMLDNRTGKPADDNTPAEYMQVGNNSTHDVEYTICAYVTIPDSMDRTGTISSSYRFVLPVEKLRNDSQKEVVPMFYLFDTSNKAAEAEAEKFLKSWATADKSKLMYQSKATMRAEFSDFQNMFLLLGGLLCGIVGFVGILNFFNAIMTGILSRKKEFAVLQAVGMTNKQLKAMLVYEGLFYALSSVLLALVLSVIIGPLSGNVLENMFWFFSANFNIIPVVVAMPVFALIGWLIPSFMYDHTAKQSIVEQLRDVS